MTGLDYILDGLEAELALERELGVRSFELDRRLLAPLASPAAPAVETASPVAPVPAPAPAPAPAPLRETVPPPPSRKEALDFVFLHDRPLTPQGEEMMAKIVSALGRTPETAPVVVAPPVPAAKVYVVLGRYALRKWFPGKNVAPGGWFTSEKGKEILVTQSPGDILRFSTVTPALKKMKLEMWTSIKSVLRKIDRVG